MKEEGEKERRTIFVGNLPLGYKRKKIKNLFKVYGEVESIRLRSIAVQGTAVDKCGDQVKHKFFTFFCTLCAFSIFSGRSLRVSDLT